MVLRENYEKRLIHALAPRLAVKQGSSSNKARHQERRVVKQGLPSSKNRRRTRNVIKKDAS
jgi:hypothetical protein